MLSQALAYHKDGALGEAESSYLCTLNQYPHSVDAKHLLGMLYHETSRGNEALDLLLQAKEQFPESADLRNSLGVVLLGLSKIDQADLELTAATDLNPNLAEAQSNLGIVRQSQRRFDDALGCFFHAIRLAPNDGIFRYRAGQLALNQGNLSLAEQLLSQSVSRLAPGSIPHQDAMLALASCLRRMQRPQEALEVASNLLVHDNLSAQAWLEVGLVYDTNGKSAKARTCFERSIDQNPELAEGHFRYSISLLHAGERKRSLHAAARATGLSPTDQYVAHLVLVLDKFASSDEKLSALRSLSTDGVCDSLAAQRLGDLMQRRGEIEEAINFYLLAVVDNPRMRRSLMGLAHCCEQTHKLGRLINMCKKLLEQDDESAAVHLVLGLALCSRIAAEQRRQLNMASRDEMQRSGVKHLKRAVELERSPETLDALGKGLIGLGDHEQALALLNEAVELDPVFAPACESLGRAKLELGQIEEAKACFEKAVGLSCKCVEAEFELARSARTSDPTSIARITKRLGGDHLQPRHRALLWLALGHRLESKNDYAGAFDAFLEAGRLKTPFGVDRSPNRVLEIDDVMRRYSGAILEQRTIASRPGAEPIFIIGMPRSGTTLVEQILTTNAEIYGAGERNDIQTIANDLQRHHRRSDGGVPDSEYDRLASRYANSVNAGRQRKWTDKMPTNFRHLGLIAAMFPNATIVEVRRHPMAVIMSCLRQDLTWPFCDPAAINVYRSQYERLMCHWKNVLPIKILSITYEDLVLDFESTSRSLVSHCGLEWCEDFLRFSENSRKVTTPSKWQVRKPLYQSSIDAWKKYEHQLRRLAVTNV